MRKYTVKIDGMMCGMCEAHISDTIRKAVPDAKKVTASRKSGEATFLTDTSVDTENLFEKIKETGYTPLSVEDEEYRKKGLFGR